MRGEQLKLELLAAEVRRRAGLNEDDNELATTIATRLLGPNGITIDPELRGPAYLRRRSDGGYQIVVRPNLPDVRFAIVHEIGHYAVRELSTLRLDPTSEERAANYLAAAILAPPTMIRRAHAFYGERLRLIARAFGLSQTSTVLRLAEVLSDERAVVTRSNNVIVRGASWARVPVIAIARGKLRWKGLSKAPLRGGIDEGRVALRVK